MQTTYEDSTVRYQAIGQFFSINSIYLEADKIVEDLSARVKQLECTVEAQSRSSSSVEHKALVDAYKGLLRVQAEKRLDLVAMISNFQDELAACKKKQSDESVSRLHYIESLSEAEWQTGKGWAGWTLILSHLGVAIAVYSVIRTISKC